MARQGVACQVWTGWGRIDADCQEALCLLDVAAYEAATSADSPRYSTGALLLPHPVANMM